MNKKIKYSALFCATLITVGTALAIKVGREVVNAESVEKTLVTFDFEDAGAHRTSGTNSYKSNTYKENEVTITCSYTDIVSSTKLGGSYNATMRVAKNTTNEPTLLLDSIPLNGKTISKIAFSTMGGVDTLSYKMEYSTDGSNWTSAIDEVCSTSKAGKTVDNLSISSSTLSIKFTGYITPDSSTNKPVTATGNRDLYVDDITLYYNEEITGYTVAFDTKTTKTVTSQYDISSGSKVTKPTDPTNGGYTFAGWYKDTNSNGTKDASEPYWNFDSDTVTENFTLTAAWTKIEFSPITTEFEKNSYYRIQAEMICQTSSSNYYVQSGEKGFLIYDNKGKFNGITPGTQISFAGQYTVYNTMGEFQNIVYVDVEEGNTNIDSQPLTSFDDIKSDNLCRYVYLSKIQMKNHDEKPNSNGVITANFEGTETLFSGYENKTTGFMDGDNCIVSDGKFYDVTGVVSYLKGSVIIIPLAFSASYSKVTFADCTGVADQYLLSGEKVAKPTTDPTKTGYRFDGWYLDANSNGTFDVDEKTYDFTTSVTDNTQLVAKWVKQVNVSFTGVSDTENPATQTFDEGKTATKPTDPAKTKNRFDGWYASEATTAYDFTTAVTEDTTLTAKWTELYDVTFVGTETITSTVGKGEKVTKPTTDPTKTNYKFDGWYLDSDKDGEIDADEKAYDFDTAVTSDIQLLAKWVELYNVTIVGDKTTTSIVEKGAKVSKPATDPEKKGNNFDGWYLDANKNGTIDSTETAYDFDTAVTSDIQIIAKWTPSNPIAITVATYKSVMNVAYTYKASVVSSTEVTYSKVDFRLMVGVESAFLYNTGAKAADDYGIVVTDSKGKVMKFSAKEGSTSYTDFSLTRDRSYSYVVIDLGDVLNNTDRATNAFTVQCYVTLEGDDYTNSGKTYSVAQMIEAYYGMDDYKDSVEDTYNLFKALGLIK